MPAPVPIQIRYGPAGLLGQAAAAAGSYQGFSQQRDRDVNFLNNEMNRRQQSLIAQQQLEQESRKLEMAHALELERLRGSSATHPSSFGSPMAESIAAMKQSYLNNALSAGVEGPQKDILTQLLSDPNVDPSMFKNVADQSRLVADETARQARSVQKAGLDRTAKAGYLKNIQGRLPADASAALQFMASDDNVDMEKFRVAADAATTRANVAVRTKMGKQVQDIDDQINQLQEYQSAIEREMVKNGESPTQSSASFGGKVAPPDKEYGRLGLFGGPVSIFSAVSPGNAEGIKRRLDWTKVDRAIQGLRAKRDAAVAQVTGVDATGPMAATAAPQSVQKQLTPQAAFAILQEAGGDKDKAREIARSRGFTF